MIIFAIWLWKHSTWCSTATQFNTSTKRQFSHLWQPVPNDVNSDQEQSTKTTIPHSVDDAHIWRHAIKSVAIFFVFLCYSSFRKMWLRQWTVKIGITILLGLTPAFIQWFSPKSHTQGILNWGKVLQTHILMFYLIWYEVIIGLKCRILAIFHVYKGKKLCYSQCYNRRLQDPS